MDQEKKNSMYYVEIVWITKDFYLEGFRKLGDEYHT